MLDIVPNKRTDLLLTSGRMVWEPTAHGDTGVGVLTMDNNQRHTITQNNAEHHRNIPYNSPRQYASAPHSKDTSVTATALPELPRLLNRPPNVPPADNEKLIILEAARTQVLTSPDPEMQLTWAQDVLSYMEVSIEDKRRATQETGSKASQSEQVLHADALNIVQFLADQHHPRGQYMKGMWLEFGKFGYTQDKPGAFRCYKRAAAKGFARAEYRLGMQFEFTNEPIKALQHYKAGERQGDAASCYRMGMIALLGQMGQRQDYVTALRLIFQAADAADENAPQGAYVWGMLQAKELPQITVPETHLAYDLKSARHYIEKAAYLGFSKAQLKMGSAYELCSLGCDFSPLLSMHYNILAARQGEAEAEMSISKWFLCGYEGLFSRSESLAFAYAQRAATNGLPTAEFAMGYFYEIGVHVGINLMKARRWYERAARDGNADAWDRIEGMSKAHILSRTDHENVAMTRIKSQHGSRKGQRPQRLNQPSVVPQVPSLGGTSAEAGPGRMRDQLSTQQLGRYNSPSMPNDVHRQQELSYTTTGVSVHDQKSGTSPDYQFTDTPITLKTDLGPIGGFLSLNLDEVPFSAMLDDRLMSDGRTLPKDVPPYWEPQSTVIHSVPTNGRRKSLAGGSAAPMKRATSPKREATRESGNPKLLQSQEQSSPATDALHPYDQPPEMLGLNIGYLAPLEPAPTLENNLTTNPNETPQSLARGRVAGRASPRVLHRRQGGSPSQASTGSSPASTFASMPYSASKSFQGGSTAPTTPRMSTLSHASTPSWEKVRATAKPPSRGPKTFEEMGVPHGRNETDCVSDM